MKNYLSAMAYIDTQPLETFIFEGLRQFVGEHAGSRQSVDTASEVVHSLSLALKNTVLFSQDLHPSDFSSQLEDSLDWVKLHKFMEVQRAQNPYPLFLQRAHMHGELFPRFVDYMTEQPCDSFASDGHAVEEWQCESELSEAIMGIEESLPTVSDLAEEIATHLFKTQINRAKSAMDGCYCFSRFISLSGDMRWTLHTSFIKHSRQKAGQESGLAIFDTTILMDHGAVVFRVSDLVLFLDKEPRYRGSAINALARYWAKNADEYICWDMIPKQALVKFIPCDTLIDVLAPEKMFLMPEFMEARSLACFRQKAQVPISVDCYARRISLFLCDLMHEISPNTKADRLIEYLFANLRDPQHWGYHIDGHKHYLERKVLAVIVAEYACAIGSWTLNDKFSVDLQHCADLQSEYRLKAEELLLNG